MKFPPHNNLVFILVKKRHICKGIYSRTQHLEVRKVDNTEAIVYHPVSLWQAKPSQQENIRGIINTKLGQHVSGPLPRADLKEGNMNTNKVYNHFPDILSNIHIRVPNRSAWGEIKGHLVTSPHPVPSLPSSAFIQRVPAKIVFYIVTT